MRYSLFSLALALSSSAFAASEYPMLDCPVAVGGDAEAQVAANVVLTSPKHANVAKVTVGGYVVEIPCFGGRDELTCQTFDGTTPISGNGWSFTVRQVAGESIAVAHRYADRLGTKTYVFVCQKPKA